MIKLSNGHFLKWVVPSGALAFSGKGWWWERPLLWFGLIKPELFTVVVKSLTLKPRNGNLNWWNPLTWLPFSPWSCVRFLPGGVVNKVGLTNPGVRWWLEKVAPKIDFKKQAIIVSLFGTKDELVTMVRMLNHLPIVGFEINDSCPNSGHGMSAAESAIASARAVKEVAAHPLLYKVSAAQEYMVIAAGLVDIVEAIAINSVPYEMVYTDGSPSPLRQLELKVGGGGGGVSGKPAQHHNWKVVKDLVTQGLIPVIGPSIMEAKDVTTLQNMGASAFSFGAIHLRAPCKATTIVMSLES